jgi:hypothetical protein
MKSLKDYKKDKRGIFGLTAVQQFFVVILGIALLAYVIVIIMGTLQSANIITNGVTTAQNMAPTQLANILANTSSGVSGFFNSINPVYAILAVLVIILVLVVLVRVVSAPGSSAGTPAL